MTLRSIQVLRAIAAVAVVLFHLFPGRFNLGAAGVDVFFVVSGFIMVTTGAQDGPGAFLRKRFARIIPLYWGVTLLMCATGAAGLFARFSFDLNSLARSLLFIPYADAAGNVWPLVVVGWTLNYEVFFYLIFALGLLLGRPVAFTVAAIGLLVAAGMIFRPGSVPAGVWTDQILLEFVFGALLAKVTGPRDARLGGLLLAAGAAGFLAWSPQSPTPEWRAALWGLPALLLVAGAVIVERAGRWPRLPALEALGDASYSLYLVHGVAIAAVHRALGQDLATVPVALVVTLAATWLCFHSFEQPMARLLRRGHRPRATDPLPTGH